MRRSTGRSERRTSGSPPHSAVLSTVSQYRANSAARQRREASASSRSTAERRADPPEGKGEGGRTRAHHVLWVDLARQERQELVGMCAHVRGRLGARVAVRLLFGLRGGRTRRVSAANALDPPSQSRLHSSSSSRETPRCATEPWERGRRTDSLRKLTWSATAEYMLRARRRGCQLAASEQGRGREKRTHQ